MPVDTAAPYDPQNIFAKILRGEIPSKPVYEDEYALAIPDINPQAPTHLLVLPKGAYVSWDDFTARASDTEIAGFIRAVGTVARAAGLAEPGYRLMANTGPHAHQTVAHLHVHIMAGRPLGPLLHSAQAVDAMIARGVAIG
ncbi:MAG: histidine triad nucleotide-binding protein [Alphaproteobacteria bacterium HGW-Alphaproteobacteria-16]|nr:MAG: histidine triad nucleotide-binding protein [Alphaproteobacteria bacterium HGW-Alphaproteobacteria-16]